MSDRDRIMHSSENWNFPGFTPPPSPILRHRARKARSSLALHLHRKNPVVRTFNYDSSEQPSTSRSDLDTPANHVNMYDNHHDNRNGGNDERPKRPDSPVPNHDAYWYWYPQELNLGIMANRLINDARLNATIDERVLQCPNCFLLPLMPVTGVCGHTRCLRCIEQFPTCPCDIPHSPWLLNVTIIIEEIIQKLLTTETGLRDWMSAKLRDASSNPPQSQLADLAVADTTLTPPKLEGIFTGKSQIPNNDKNKFGETLTDCEAVEKGADSSEAGAKVSIDLENARCIDMEEEAAWGPVELAKPAEAHPTERIPITPHARIGYARHLIGEGQHEAAVPHLARAAISDTDLARRARRLLIRALSELSEKRNLSELETELRQLISSQAVSNWLPARDLECVFCFDTYSDPVTTPCGHTFCRSCLERSFDYRSNCALCMQSLFYLQFNDTCVTEFVSVALAAIGESKLAQQPDPHVIPILACTVAFPGMPCPLFLFNPRYWYMIRRILESGSRKFGMVALERDGTHSEYGTLLEIRDCVPLEDGCTIVTTIGLSRFRVVEKDIWDGGYRWCDVARVEPVVDIPIEPGNKERLRTLANHISAKATIWIRGMNPDLRSNIETAFGEVPRMVLRGNWHMEADGPAWLWWLISILPLKLEIKILILATNSLEKRMRAVLRTLDTSLTQPPHGERDYESALADWWQQRHL